MQKKTATKIIRNKISEWLESITDVELRNKVRSNLIVSGGCVASLLLGEDVNDFDIYIQDRAVLKKLMEYYKAPYSDVIILDGVEKEKLLDDNFREGQYLTSLRNLQPDQLKFFIEGGFGKRIVPVEGEKYKPVFFSPNAISLTDKIQIVVRFFGTPDEVHKTFDFIHATNYFTFADGIVTNLKAVESLLSRTLNYQGSLYPLTSVIRTKKFLKRKWNIGAGEYLKMMFQISELDLSNPDVLDEQLIGVDVAYFSLLIQALREHLERHPEQKVTSAFINELIDRIFSSIDNEIQD